MPKGSPNPEYEGKPRKAMLAFHAHKGNAKRRGIAFEFTFTEWWEWWQVDNRWANRGLGSDKLVMARKGDTGPYSLGNVYCATHRQNLYDVSADVREQAGRQSWLTTPTRRPPPHLTDRSQHPRNRPVETPEGTFPSVTVAAKHFGLTHGGVAYKIREGVEGWKYAKQD